MSDAVSGRAEHAVRQHGTATPRSQGTDCGRVLSTCDGVPKDTVPKDTVSVQVSAFLRISPSARPCPGVNRARLSLPFSISYWFPIMTRAVPLIPLLSQPLLNSEERAHRVQGCKADPGKESPLLRSAGMQDLATWNPDRRHAFSCPARSEPPWGRCVHFSREPSLHQPSLNLLPRNSSSPQPGL